MLNFYIAVSACLAIIFIILGLIVVSRNSSSYLHKIFLIFSILISGWLLTNYIGGNSQYSHKASLIANRLVFVFGIYTALALVLFVKELTLKRSSLIWKSYIALNLILGVLCLTPLVVNDVARHGDTYVIDFGSIALVYFLILVTNFITLIATAIIARKKERGAIKAQIDTMLASLGFTLGGVIITNALLPFLFNYYGLSNAGSFLTAVLVSGLAYSMIKHKLFDLRLFVVRSVVYLLTFSVIALIYVLPTVILTSYVSKTPLKTGTFLVITALTLLAAILFQPLRSKFNRVTNRFFFRDYYDPQEVLDQLSNLLVGTVDVKKIESGSTGILSGTIRPSTVNFLLLANQAEKETDLMRLLLAYRKDLAVFDELDTQKHGKLHEELGKDNIALTAKLKTSHEDLGFILLGFKQSGAIYTDADIKLLGIIADEIAIGLQNALHFEEIQRFNITLQQKVDEATKQLQHANHRLKELDQTKDEFISMASHQLRTPLTTIKGYLSMILEGDVGPVTKNEKQMIQYAFDGAERMVFLIADLLNVSRLQSGKFVIDNKPTDLAKMVDAQVNQLQETAKNHHLTLTYEKPDKFPQLNIDETKIQQVVMNFMDNAIFYTPANGSIEVALEATDSEIRYTVTDTGLGVPKAEQHHLFAKFYRAGNARKMRPDGTGLGLFMAKKVVVAQGGAIIFRSTEGKGSTFGFSFPRKAVELKEGATKEKAKEMTPEPAKAVAAK